MFPLRILKQFQKRSISIFSQSSSLIYGEEHRNIQASLLKLIEKEINPHIQEWEEANIFPAKTIFKLLGDGGFLGVDKPREYGGLGLDYTYNIAVSEQLGAISCGSLPMAISVQLSMITPALVRYGSDYLKEQFLKPTVTGDIVGCIGVSEPGGGSDVASVKTFAKVDGDDLVINGEKMWITNSLQADWMCLLANTETDQKNPYFNKSLIVLPMNLPGITRHKINKMGMLSSDTGHIFFDNVRVPRSHIIGESGQGFVYQMKQFQEERMSAVAGCLVPMETIIKDTLEYCKQRKMYGKSLYDNQVVQFTLSEQWTELECLRSLLYRTIYAYTHEKIPDVTMLASAAKLKAGRLAREIPDKCLQYWGGMGYTPDVTVNRLFRDLRILAVGGGADEVMLGIVTKYMNQQVK